MIFSYEKLKSKRLAQMQQEELAGKTGISLSVIKNIESGRKKITPNSPELIKICEVLNLNPEDYFVRRTRSIAFFNNKGGVGKTSLVCSIASIMVAEFDKKVLIIDCDPQANTTQSFDMQNRVNDYKTNNLYTVIKNGEHIEEYIYNTGYENLDIVLGHLDLNNLEPDLPTTSYKEELLRNQIKRIKQMGVYDYIICDTSPTLSLFNGIVLRGVDGVVIPFEPEPHALAGIGNTVEYIEKIQSEEKRSTSNHKVNILGIVVNKYAKQEKISKAITEVVLKLYPELVYNSYIKSAAAIKKAHSEHLPICINYSKEEVYEALKVLTKEIIDGAENI